MHDEVQNDLLVLNVHNDYVLYGFDHMDYMR